MNTNNQNKKSVSHSETPQTELNTQTATSADALKDLLLACDTAADWLMRSIRIDDREQAEDLRRAMASYINARTHELQALNTLSCV